jgi:hypothetical protein
MFTEMNELNILCCGGRGGDTIFTAKNRITQILHTYTDILVQEE